MGDMVLGVPRDRIAAFCREHGIRWLAIFGSAVRDDFGPGSDLDVLVEFETGQTPGLLAFVRMEQALTDLFGRRVDLVTRRGLSHWIAPDVLREAQVVYDAA
jgi:hypothetical protein